MGSCAGAASSEPEGAASRTQAAKLATAGREFESMASEDEHWISFLTGAVSLAEVTL
jgi:hypothetical protein